MSETDKIITLEPMLLSAPVYMPRHAIGARRSMNEYDFDAEPEEGGYRAANLIIAAKKELEDFMAARGLQLGEPFDVSIVIEVTAYTEPKPEIIEGLVEEELKPCDPRCLAPTNPHPGRCWGFEPLD